MDKLNITEVILLAIFSLFLVIGVAIFALQRGGINTDEQGGNLTIWGTLPASYISAVDDALNEAGISSSEIFYIEKTIEEFENDFINELASGRGPDLVILPHELILKHGERLVNIPFDSYPLATYQGSFVDSANIFLNAEGTLALPVFADPLVMYYNDDIRKKIFARELPKTWDGVLKYVDSVIERDGSDISQSLISLGGVSNISNLKDIISNFIIQTDNPVVVGKSGGDVEVVIGRDKNIISALNYYTEFSNPSKGAYSWNESFENALNRFTNGDLYLYLGFVSEAALISSINSNLNFKVERVPQPDGVDTPTTFNRIYGVAIPTSSSDITSSFNYMKILTGESIATGISQSFPLIHARKNIPLGNNTSSNTILFYDSALIGNNWRDIDPVESGNIFTQMVRDIVNGSLSSDVSLERAALSLQQIYR